MTDIGSTWSRRLIWMAAFAVAFIVAFVGVKALKRHWFDKRTDEAIAAASERKLANIREEAMKKDPDAPISEAMKKEAARQMTADLESQAGDKARQSRTAADQFWGFLLVNTRSGRLR